MNGKLTHYVTGRNQAWPRWKGTSLGANFFLCHCMSLVCLAFIGVRQHLRTRGSYTTDEHVGLDKSSYNSRLAVTIQS